MSEEEAHNAGGFGGGDIEKGSRYRVHVAKYLGELVRPTCVPDQPVDRGVKLSICCLRRKTAGEKPINEVVAGPRPLAAVALTEVLATSDVPPGVVNIITGLAEELGPVLAKHMDVNAIDIVGTSDELATSLVRNAAENVKRVTVATQPDFADESAQSPYLIAKFVETKTVWHPKGV